MLTTIQWLSGVLGFTAVWLIILAQADGCVATYRRHNR
jgi:hypothetical protein